MLVESGSATILNTPQNICQTSPCVCSTYSAQHNTIHLIYQCLQNKRIRGRWWTCSPFLGLGSFLHDAPWTVFCKTRLIIPILQTLSQYPLSICSTYTSSIITVCEHPSLVLGKCYYLQGRISTFHLEWWGEGGCYKRHEGILLGCTPPRQTPPAIFDLLLPAAPRQLAWPCPGQFPIMEKPLFAPTTITAMVLGLHLCRFIRKAHNLLKVSWSKA